MLLLFLIGPWAFSISVVKDGLKCKFHRGHKSKPCTQNFIQFLSIPCVYLYTHTHIFLSAPHPLLYMKGNKGAERDVGEAVFTEKTPVADNDSLRAITWRRKVETK